MIKEALEYFLDKVTDQVVEVDTLPYSVDKLTPIMAPMPLPLVVNTLTAVVEYIEEVMETEEKNEKDFFIHVVNEGRVTITSKLNEWEQRAVQVAATTDAYPQLFKFGQKYSIEDFLIALQSSFVPTESVATLVRILGNVQAGKVKTSVDDGVSQTVLTKQGSTLLSEEKCPNPIVLYPWRTFREVDQPASSFVFRLHQNGDCLPTCALYEADGTAWKLEAIKSIAKFLEERTVLPVIA